MSYVVSARKYRPQQFDEVVGQSHVSSTLQKALDSDQIAHAFLFCGPRGIGKTSCARIMAKVLNCENKPNAHTACNTCSSCQSFNDNASFNIIELDAASNNSVENIRTLIEQVRFQPQQGKYKIFIIDEVHMLSTSAFNAFLKTLEEPPPFAIFILATTEKHKIIPTILSRCQVFDFKRIMVDDIVGQLKMIAEAEKIAYEIEALHVIGQKADGAMRDALSIFDRMASTNEMISYEQVVKNLNILDYDSFFKFTEALLAEDLSSVLLQFNDIVKRGFEPDHFMNGLAGHFRNLMVAQSLETSSLLNGSDQLKSRYTEQAKLVSRDYLLTAMNLANQCDIHYPMAKNKVLHAEISLCKMAKINRVFDLKKIAALPAENKTSNKKSSLSESYTKNFQEGDKSNVAEKIKTVRISPSRKPKVAMPKVSSLEDLVQQVVEEESNNIGETENLDLQALKRVWNEYVEQIESKVVASSLKNVQLECDEEEIRIFVPSQIIRETVLQEDGLLEKIRTNFNIPNMPFSVIADIKRFPDFKAPEKKKILSSQEKFEQLNKMNPMVQELIKRFDLKPDNE